MTLEKAVRALRASYSPGALAWTELDRLFEALDAHTAAQGTLDERVSALVTGIIRERDTFPLYQRIMELALAARSEGEQAGRAAQRAQSEARIMSITVERQAAKERVWAMGKRAAAAEAALEEARAILCDVARDDDSRDAVTPANAFQYFGPLNRRLVELRERARAFLAGKKTPERVYREAVKRSE